MGHQCRKGLLCQSQSAASSWVYYQQVSGWVLRAISSDRHGFCEVGPVRLETAISEDFARAIHAENRDTGKGWANVTPQYGASSRFVLAHLGLGAILEIWIPIFTPQDSAPSLRCP